MSPDPGATSRPPPAEARAAVAAALRRIIPDADLEAIGDAAPFRSELELDSLDFLSFVESLSGATGIRIDEVDYPRLGTIEDCVRFLTSS